MARDFPIVGIGASAGGLVAFEAFFAGMPPGGDPGMAFVLVQHLAPNHESLLVELVRRYTQLEVSEVTDGMAARPNHVYVIPPNRDMALFDGRLRLFEPNAPHGRRLPIDSFFRSLAQDQRENAIGIVLSGSGSDGALGVRAIKGEGGIVLVQRPDSTEYDGMPRAALATGMADYELTPAEMPARLLAYSAHRRKQPDGGSAPPLMGGALEKLLLLLRTQTGHDFSQYKPSTLHRRVERRMAVHQIESPDEFVRYVRATPTEVDALFRDLLIGVTSFFRDPEAFEALATHAVSALATGRGADRPIRVWVPACSTGEEAYSLAILFAEALRDAKATAGVQIFATDIDARAIATARAGCYPSSIAADVSPERLARFFVPGPGPDDAEGRPAVYTVRKAIRDLLIFSEQDVVRDPPFSRLDLISCRNLLIYLSADLQRRLLPLFHYALSPGAYLFLGTSESVGDAGDLFRTLDRRSKVYQRRDDYTAAPHRGPRRFVPLHAPASHTRPEAAVAQAGPPGLSLRELAEQALLRTAVPAAALVTHTGDVLYIHGRTGAYLEPAPGVTGVNNILKMAREDLRRALTTALHRAASGGEAVATPGIPIRVEGSPAAVDLTVTPVPPLPQAAPAVPLLLVTLAPGRAEPPPSPPEASDAATDARGGSAADRIAGLEAALRAREDYIQTTTEELLTSNEELKSSNEELQSVNEELQSTNEELETSKEELQSVNEELSTVNAELQTKVADLSQVNNDMSNLLAGTGIGTIFVDTSLRILRFTPAATRIVNLIPGDVGRPVAHVASNLVGDESLADDVTRVLDTLIPVTRDVRTRDGGWYSMRLLPYRTLENVIEGAVLSFVDVSAERRAQEQVRLNEARMRVALAASGIRLTNQDASLSYTWAHDPREGALVERVLGKTDADLLPAEQAAPLTAFKRGVVESGVGARGRFEMTLHDDTALWDLTAEPLRSEAGRVIGITCAAVEVRPGTAGD